MYLMQENLMYAKSMFDIDPLKVISITHSQWQGLSWPSSTWLSFQ